MLGENLFKGFIELLTETAKFTLRK